MSIPTAVYTEKVGEFASSCTSTLTTRPLGGMINVGGYIAVERDPHIHAEYFLTTAALICRTLLQ